MSILLEEGGEEWAKDLNAKLEVNEADDKRLAAAPDSSPLGRETSAIARLKQQSLFRDRRRTHAHHGEFLKQRTFRFAATMRMSSAVRRWTPCCNNAT